MIFVISLHCCVYWSLVSFLVGFRNIYHGRNHSIRSLVEMAMGLISSETVIGPSWQRRRRFARLVCVTICRSVLIGDRVVELAVVVTK